MSKMINNITSIIDGSFEKYLEQIDGLDITEITKIPSILLEVMESHTSTQQFAKAQGIDVQEYLEEKDSILIDNVKSIITRKIGKYSTVELLTLLDFDTLSSECKTIPSKYADIRNLLLDRKAICFANMVEDLHYATSKGSVTTLRAYHSRYRNMSNKTKEVIANVLEEAVQSHVKLDEKFLLELYNTGILAVTVLENHLKKIDDTNLANTLYNGDLLKAYLFKSFLINKEYNQLPLVKTLTEKDLLYYEGASGVLTVLRKALQSLSDCGVIQIGIPLPEGLLRELKRIEQGNNSQIFTETTQIAGSKAPIHRLLAKIKKNAKVSEVDFLELDDSIVNPKYLKKGTQIKGFGYISLIQDIADNRVLSGNIVETELVELLQSVEGLSLAVTAKEEVYTDIYLDMLKNKVTDDYYKNLLKNINIFKIMNQVDTVISSESVIQQSLLGEFKLLVDHMNGYLSEKSEGTLVFSNTDICTILNVIRNIGEWTYSDLSELIHLFTLVALYENDRHNVTYIEELSKAVDILSDLEGYDKGKEILKEIQQKKKNESTFSQMFGKAPDLTFEDLAELGLKIPPVIIPYFNQIIVSVVKDYGFSVFTPQLVQCITKYSAEMYRMVQGSTDLNAFKSLIQHSESTALYFNRLLQELATPKEEPKQEVHEEVQKEETITKEVAEEVSKVTPEVQTTPHREVQKPKRNLFAEDYEESAEEGQVPEVVVEPVAHEKSKMTEKAILDFLEFSDTEEEDKKVILQVALNKEVENVKQLKEVLNFFNTVKAKSVEFSEKTNTDENDLEQFLVELKNNGYVGTSLHTDLSTKLEEIRKVKHVLSTINARLVTGRQQTDDQRFR